MTSIASPVVIDWREAADDERFRLLSRGGVAGHLDPRAELTHAIAKLVERVRSDGDKALVEALAEFDGVDVDPGSLRVSEQEVRQAVDSLPARTLEAVRVAISQVRAFNEAALARAEWRDEVGGIQLGELVKPIESTGLYVPAGKGSFPSALIMVATPAVVAGVQRIVLVVPPTPGTGGRIDPALLAAAEMLGITEIYRSNGPAGIAALACGTETISAVRKIVGPGSPAVTVAMTEAQRLGCVVEVGFGPTDSLIVCDGRANPVMLAADLVNEAEHGSDSSAVLVGTDLNVLRRTAEEVAKQIAALPARRRDYARASIYDNGGIVLVGSPQEAMDIANSYAPEHLQLAVADPDAWLALVRHAGTVLLGQWTTMAASNFAIGTPATLPTTGFAKVVSGVSVHTYLTRIPVARLEEEAFWRLAPTIRTLAEHEGFPAHANSVTIREGRNPGS
ncbi:histidinol dehydrogenase [Nonomuraea aurantiaca]|uniref:histidinol dehydrogenase n=1 Tax=Nonomuraea aurantiaca TaxID=2878562 RepID=UPI001CD96E9F|nr:histidinol dehydrogenase [Nonomuraea aurantiaca]MCA2228734.1 histidinol dehydrogenase [Nonomuraea aurantiaca]